MAFIDASIHSALHYLELLQRSSSVSGPDFTKRLIYRLRNVRTFLLCERKLGKDGSRGSLRIRITDVVCRFVREMQPYCRGLETGIIPKVVEIKVIRFQREMKSFEEEINERYATYSEISLQSSSPGTDDVLKITDSLLKNLEDIFCFHSENKLSFLELVKDFRANIICLRTFAHFATMQRVKHPQLKSLLTQIEAVAVNAAHISPMYQFATPDEEWWEKLQQKISDLLQKIKPINPQVYEAYTQVLTSSNLSTELHSPAPKMNGNRVLNRVVIIEEFIDSLASNLWEMLQLETCLVVSLKDQLQVLYEGLRFLRTMLKEQLDKFGYKNMNLTEVVMCEAGRIIFSLSQKDVKIDMALSDLLGRIKLIREDVEEKVPKGLTFNFPKTNELGFVDFLLEYLVNFTINNVDSNVHSYVQTIQEHLVFLRSFLEEIDGLRSEQEELQSLWDRVVLVAYKIEFLIDHVVFGGILDSFQMSFHSITEEIKIIERDALKIFDGKGQDMTIKKVSKRSSRVLSQRSTSITNEVVGFVDEATSIVDRLTRGSKQLRIVSIVGMGGSGKTTLATKVYNDPSVLHHFNVCAWYPVSQVFNKKKVLLGLLNHIISEKYSDMTEEDLAEKLRRHLKGRRYLIFLDDVWGIEVWNSLEVLLPDDSNGSRIILTSRLEGAAPQNKLDEKPHFLRQLTTDESWKLFQRKLFNGEACPPTLFGLGMKISENCKGLPLTIIIVAGVLAMRSMEQESWKEVLESLSSGAILASSEQCMKTMELSYKDLPEYLKPCFLYFGAFPENQEVSVERLIQLWIAEGFVRKTELMSLEDVARDYLMDLIGRSLVVVGKERSIGGVKACGIHDLLHEFCLTKAKEEQFFWLLRGYDELLAFNEPCNLRRLCIHSKPEHFKDSRLFCPRVRTLLFFSEAKKEESILLNISFVTRIFKLLRVLDLKQIPLGYVFPSEMELLTHLKYLEIQGEMEVFPSSFGNLSNLETFIVYTGFRKVSLPDTLWNLRRLKHLSISNRSWFVLPTKNMENSSNLYELNSLSGAIVSWPHLEEQLRKIQNIRKLKCQLVGDDTGCSKIMICDILSQLESLHMSLSWSHRGKVGNHIELGFPVTLKKLTLYGFRMPWSKISNIGRLPNLQVLNLLQESFAGDSWDMEEEEFPKLRILKLSGLELESWTGSDEHFPCLQKLVVDGCSRLKEMPCCLEDISTLDMIEVLRCSESTINCVKQIGEKQMSMGNSGLKVLVRRF